MGRDGLGPKFILTLVRVRLGHLTWVTSNSESVVKGTARTKGSRVLRVPEFCGMKTIDFLFFLMYSSY